MDSEQTPTKLRPAGLKVLQERLATSVGILLGGAPPEHDERLFEAMISLYCIPPARIFDEMLCPWIRARMERLELVFGEHLALPRDLPLLDTLEALLVLERLDRDRTGLVRNWPYSPSELWLVQDAWGERLCA